MMADRVSLPRHQAGPSQLRQAAPGKALDLGVPIGHPAGGPGFSDSDGYPRGGFRGPGFRHRLQRRLSAI